MDVVDIMNIQRIFHSDPELEGLLRCISESEKMGVTEWLTGRLMDSRCQAGLKKAR